MKTFLRMLGFVAVGFFISFIAVQVITLTMMLSFPAEVYERAAQGERAAGLRAALQAEKINAVSNIVLWPLALGLAYGLERGWRAWRRQAAIQSSKGIRRLGAAALGLIAALGAHGAYTLALAQSLPAQYLAQPANYGPELADFGQQLDGRVWVFLITWVGVGLLAGWLAGQEQTDAETTGPASSAQVEPAPAKIEENEPSEAHPIELTAPKEEPPPPAAASFLPASVSLSPPAPATPPAASVTPGPARSFRPPLLLWLFLVGAILLIGLAVVGFAGYWFLGQREFTAGLTAYEAADCRTARDHFNRVAGLYRWTFSPRVTEAEARLSECVLLNAADNSREQLHYAEAVAGYETYLRQYPQTIFESQAQQAVTETYEQWAAQLRTEHLYQEAIEKYQALHRNYPDTPAAQQTAILAAEVYGEWAAQLRTEKNYEAALEKYQILLNEYLTTPTGQQAADLAAGVISDWAAQLRAEAQYQAAIEKYQSLAQDYPDTLPGQQAAPKAAEVYGEWAAQLRDNGQYEQALEQYQTLLNEYPGTPTGQQAAALAAEVYAEWAARLRAEAEYETAIKLYETLGQTYPDTPVGRQAAARAAEVYGEWAAHLRGKGEYEEAVEKYQTLLSHYPDTASGRQAATLAVEVYAEWAIQLQQKGQYQPALEKYHIMARDYPDATPSQQAASLASVAYGKWLNQLWADNDFSRAIKAHEIFTNLFPGQDVSSFLAKTYLTWGQYLYSQQQYFEAMDKFSQAQQASQDAETISMAQQGYFDALTGISEDTGTQGQQLIKKTWNEVCGGQPASSPAVGFVRASEPGRAWFGRNEFSLAGRAKAVNPGHFRAAVCLQERVEEVERCEYTGGYAVIRQRPWWRVTVRDTRTAVILYENSFYGSQPARCSFSESFSFSQRTKYRVGDPPSGEEISSWLARLNYPVAVAATASPAAGSPTPTASTPAAPTTGETPAAAAPAASGPDITPLESDVSVDQIGEREVTDVDINPRNPREVYVLVKGDGIYKSINGGDGPWAKMRVDGSAITAFVIDPSNPTTFYAPTWNGVLKSTDGGNTWQVKTNGLGIPNRPVDVITVHPTKPNIVYGGIGETLIVSPNGGESWSTPADAYGGGLGVSRFYQIVIDPFNPDIIYVGGAAGEIYKSDDAGRNFTRLGFNTGQGAFSLAAHPTQQGVYLAGINSYDAGIIKTENGADFRSVSAGLIFGGADSAYSALAYVPSNPKIVYAGSGYEDDTFAKGIFKSADGGESWTRISNGLSLNPTTGQPHYVKVMAAHPTDPNIVLAATGGGVYKSVDGGASWSLR